MTVDEPDEPVVDPALVVPIVEITRRIGTRRLLVVDTRLHAPAVAGVVVPDARPVTGTLVIESVLDGIVVAGTLHAPWSGECRRCLDPIEGIIDVPVHELFENRPTPGETYPIDGDHIDCNPLVREAVLLALPLNPICRPDCPGPDPDRFPTVVEADPTPPTGPDAAGHADPAPLGDPRWAALDRLRFEE